MAKLDVFVSHVTIEGKFADLLRECLARDFIGLLKLFISTDATSIPVGSQWFDRLLAAIGEARLHFVVCSPESVRRPWIHYEAGAARMRGVELVPLCHSGIRPEQLPVPLGMSEGVVLTDAQDLAKLYARIAEILESDVPDVAFDAYAAGFRALEEEYSTQLRADEAASRRRSEEAIVEAPRVLCVTSEQFRELGFQNQLEIVLEAFPENLRHGFALNSRDLEATLMKERVDIVHIAAYVCPRTGVMYFSPVDLPTGAAIGDSLDLIRPEAFAKLLDGARTRLVVIASGDSLALATGLLPVTNVIAPRDLVSAKALAVWVRAFYTSLRVRTLKEACEYAAAVSQVPMRLLAQQVELPDLQFGPRAGTGPARVEGPDAGR